MKVSDFWRLLLYAVLGTALGAIWGHILLGVVFSLLAYIWNLHHSLVDLLNQVNGASNDQRPKQSGVFEEVNYSISKLFDSHKSRRQRLTAVLRQFEQATRAWPDAIVILNQTDDIEWANPAARRLLDVRWPEDKKQRITNIIRFPTLREFISSTGNIEQQTVDIISPLKTDVHLSALIVPYSKTHKILTARDVTEIYRAIKVRSDFVANVSHELKTPLTVFRGYLEALTMQSDICPPTWQPALEQMTEHAIEMSSLVDTLLNLSHLEESQIPAYSESIDIKLLLEEVVTATNEIYKEKNHVLTIHVDSQKKLTGSRVELYSALSNLTFNAAHYTQENGAISIRWYEQDPYLVLEVKDNGIGIAEEHLARITERFYRVDNSRTRTEQGSKNGLGLAIVKHVVRRHSALLNISSELGKGSCFSIKFKQ
jgi:two-component system phosphate regulon sensor histidine kinase PhoR